MSKKALRTLQLGLLAGIGLVVCLIIITLIAQQVQIRRLSQNSTAAPLTTPLPPAPTEASEPGAEVAKKMAAVVEANLTAEVAQPEAEKSTGGATGTNSTAKTEAVAGAAGEEAAGGKAAAAGEPETGPAKKMASSEPGAEKSVSEATEANSTAKTGAVAKPKAKSTSGTAGENSAVASAKSAAKPSPLPPNPPAKKSAKLPKLAIIMDDMATPAQAKKLKALGLKITPSFFPPDKNHPHTARLARDFDFFMVHLPLAALDYPTPELNTLPVHASQEQIEARLGEIKRDFAGLKFINNHTGSAFTADAAAMGRLYAALNKNGLFFIDSKTINSPVARNAAAGAGAVYLARDIFLDNEDGVDYVKNQIKKALALAAKQGQAIAIAHPRKNTFAALAQSKDLLGGVRLVYVSELYE